MGSILKMNEEKDMNLKQRRVRGSNFTKEEELSLVLKVAKYKDIIECKATDKISNSDKNEAWKKIESSFNANNNSFRSMQQLKIKYDNLKIKARRILAECSWNDAGGDPPSSAIVDPVMKAILEIINKAPAIDFSNNVDNDSCVSEENETSIGEDIGNTMQNEEDTGVNLMDPQVIIHSIDESVEDNNTRESTLSTVKDWKPYTSKKLKTPISKKLHQLAPIRITQDYYKKKMELIEQEIRKNELIMADILLKQKQDEERHRKNMLLLDLEIKLKQKQLNM